MTVAGNIYGVILNDAEERSRLEPQFHEKPYAAPPVAPVVYMKPLSSIATGPVEAPAGTGLIAATTVALLFARDASKVSESEVVKCLGGAALALDLSTPNPSYYRPAVANKNADGRLVLGDFAAPSLPRSIKLIVDDTTVHEWTLDRLFRSVEKLVADLSDFMTLKAGDLLLIGLPGDAPVVQAGQTLRVEADTLPAIETATKGDKA